MKKLILALVFASQTVFAASVSERYIAPAEYRDLEVNIHHADCVSGIRIYGSALSKKADCEFKVQMPRGLNLSDSVFTKLRSKAYDLKIKNNDIQFILRRTDMVCSAKVWIRPSQVGRSLHITWKFLKLTNVDHPNAVMCSKRLIEKFGNNRTMKLTFTHITPGN